MDRAGSIGCCFQTVVTDHYQDTESEKKERKKETDLFIGSLLKGTNESLIKVYQLYYFLLPVRFIHL